MSKEPGEHCVLVGEPNLILVKFIGEDLLQGGAVVSEHGGLPAQPVQRVGDRGGYPAADGTGRQVAQLTRLRSGSRESSRSR